MQELQERNIKNEKEKHGINSPIYERPLTFSFISLVPIYQKVVHAAPYVQNPTYKTLGGGHTWYKSHLLFTESRTKHSFTADVYSLWIRDIIHVPAYYRK